MQASCDTAQSRSLTLSPPKTRMTDISCVPKCVCVESGHSGRLTMGSSNHIEIDCSSTYSASSGYNQTGDRAPTSPHYPPSQNYNSAVNSHSSGSNSNLCRPLSSWGAAARTVWPRCPFPSQCRERPLGLRFRSSRTAQVPAAPSVGGATSCAGGPAGLVPRHRWGGSTYSRGSR